MDPLIDQKVGTGCDAVDSIRVKGKGWKPNWRHTKQTILRRK